jgi:thiosulfate/3-mercaptopyruvate sulfurtransferase
MPDSQLPPLVSTEWLAARLGRADVRVVDGSWYLPSSGRDAASEYTADHIPGAVFFDLDASSAADTTLPHMLPTAAEFAARMSALGLDDRSTIVVYDGSAVNLSAPRVWWTFRVFGHRAAAVLDGGLAKWKAEGRPLEPGVPRPTPGRFTARFDPSRVRDLAAIQANLPFSDLVSANGTLLAPERLRARIEAAGFDPRRPVVVTCGSATSACSLVLALELLGHDRVAVYDGSWTEWGGRRDTPVEVGPARLGA